MEVWLPMKEVRLLHNDFCDREIVEVFKDWFEAIENDAWFIKEQLDPYNLDMHLLHVEEALY